MVAAFEFKQYLYKCHFPYCPNHSASRSAVSKPNLISSRALIEICSCGKNMVAAKNEYVREKLNILKQRMRIEDKETTELI